MALAKSERCTSYKCISAHVRTNLCSCVLLLLSVSLCGCSATPPYIGGQQQDTPYYDELAAGYHQTKLRKTGALDVLNTIHKPEYELLSQSRSVVASSGRSKDGYKTWFTMVAFDENELTAKRKYFFVVDEKIKHLPNQPRRLFILTRRGLMFDSEMVLEPRILDRPYASESALHIVILKQVLSNLRKDLNEFGQSVGQLGPDSNMLAVSGMLINQVFETIFHTFDKAPPLAARLSDKAGVEFDHINFHKGRIRMTAEENIVTVEIRLGAFLRLSEDVQDKRQVQESTQ